MRKVSLLLCSIGLLMGQVFAQNRTISGTVVDGNGNPLASASVTVKGTNRGTATGVDGRFSLSVPPDARILVISEVNYKSLEISISDKTDLGTLTLQPGEKSLDEVVVVAYGTSKKTNITGSMSVIKGTEVENKPYTSVDKALQGTVAGLQSTSVSGTPGAATDIRIRGIGSILADASPLWVIDGVISTTGDLTVNTTTANPLSTLNPNDIESITVLKDAASTSIYGSRAANGVILVTTRKGKAGKTRFNISAEVGSNSRAYNPSNKPLTTPQYQTVLRQSIINGGFATDNAGADKLITDPNFLGFPANWTSFNTNWLDVVSRNGNQSQYNLSMSGGSDKTQVFASAGYFKQVGTSLASDFNRFNGAISVTHKASDKFTLSANFNGSNTSQRTPNNGGAFANPVLASFFLMPWYTPYNANGSFKYGDSLNEFPLGNGIFNPAVIAAWNKYQAQQTGIRGSASGEYRILDNVKFTTRFAGEYLAVQEDQYRNPFYGDGYADQGDAYSVFTRVFNYTWSNFADWRQNVSKDAGIYFDLKGGIEAQDYKYYNMQAGGHTFPQTLRLQYLASASTPTTAFVAPSEYATFSMFSIGDFNYRDRYVLSASFRRDESSVFGVNHRWGNFYSAGGTWNVTEEDFMKNIPAFSLLKLRTSYGENGNTNGFGYYTSLSTFGSGYNYNVSRPGIAHNNVGDSSLTWEKNKVFNAGLDFGLLKDRIGGTVEYYHRTTSSLLAAVPFSLTSGFTSQNENVGSVVNKGIEITINARPVVLRDFSWALSINFSHNINRVTALYQGRPVPNGNFQYTVGHDLQEFYLQQWAGVNPATGAPQWYVDLSRKQITGSYDSAGLALNHSAAPKYYGGFTNTFTYKGLSLAVQFNYNYGNYIFDNWFYYLNSEGQFLGGLNQWSSQLKAWQKPGDKTDVPQIIIGGNNNSNSTSTRQLYQGDYVRLRNIQLSYSLPQDLLRKARLSNLIVYMRGTNLLTFGTDKHLPYDPEAGINSTTNLEIYIPKTISGGIRVEF